MKGGGGVEVEMVRIAAEDDVEPAVQTLVKAFEDYFVARQTISATDYLDRLARYYRLFLTRIGLPHGRIWVTDDHSAVAVWTTPTTPPNPFSPLAAEFREIAGDRADVAATYEQAMGILRPSQPVWFLAVVGVDPARRSQGLGRAVIAPGLEAADADDVPAFLETQAPINVRFYERLGFDVIAELDLPGDGPKHWAMWRPRSSDR
jgi:GNAT superfamily N-acetyltransferase